MLLKNIVIVDWSLVLAKLLPGYRFYFIRPPFLQSFFIFVMISQYLRTLFISSSELNKRWNKRTPPTNWENKTINKSCIGPTCFLWKMERPESGKDYQKDWKEKCRYTTYETTMLERLKKNISNHSCSYRVYLLDCFLRKRNTFPVGENSTKNPWN